MRKLGMIVVLGVAGLAVACGGSSSTTGDSGAGGSTPLGGTGGAAGGLGTGGPTCLTMSGPVSATGPTTLTMKDGSGKAIGTLSFDTAAGTTTVTCTGGQPVVVDSSCNLGTSAGDSTTSTCTTGACTP